MDLAPSVLNAILLCAAAGAGAGFFGSLFAARSSNLLGGILLGAIGGIVAATIARVLNVDPLVSAGDSFSYVYAIIGGFLFALVVAASNK